MTRLDWLMKDREKLKDFIITINRGYYCDFCPFCNEKGLRMGCNAGPEYGEIVCKLNCEDVIGFLEEEMPTKKQMAQWKKGISKGD